MKKITASLCILLAIVLLVSCEKERNQDDYSSDEYALIKDALTLPRVINNYELQLGEHYLPNGATFPKVNIESLYDERQNNNMATLGRGLFYDKTLSLDENVSCGSCHHPDKAFSDDGRFSEGVGETITKRNSLALGTTLSFKISYNPIDPSLSGSRFSWDDSASSLSQQVKNAFSNENEMNIGEDLIKTRIEKSPYYDVLFNKAFGDGEVTEDRIATSITAFIDAISSTSSKFDEGLEYTFQFNVESNFSNFTDEENLGKKLYNTNCASCHTDKHNFTVKASANNGLDLEYEDNGIGARLNNESYDGVFKVPFLRNIGITGPYMHDGRFETLEDVVDHYSEGVQNHKNLDPLLKESDGSAKQMNFTNEEKSALVAYLHTLTDEKLASDTRFSDPFKK